MTRTLQDQLIEKGLVTTNRPKIGQAAERERLKQIKATRFYIQKVIQEERRTREIEELMGMHRPKYVRVKGSYRSR